jgi:hypothetical protein
VPANSGTGFNLAGDVYFLASPRAGDPLPDVTISAQAGTAAQEINIGPDLTPGSPLLESINGLATGRVLFRPEALESLELDVRGNHLIRLIEVGGAPRLDRLPITINALSGVNTLQGPGLDNTWQITGYGTGQLNANVSFAGISGLIGGWGADVFRFLGGTAVFNLPLQTVPVVGWVSSIDGGDGTNTLDFGAYALPAHVAFASGAPLTGSYTGRIDDPVTSTRTAAVGSFSRITNFVGNAGSTLVGPDQPSTWAMTGTNSGQVAGATFSGFENLTGGSSDDTFAFHSGASLSGTLDGGGGVNALDDSAYQGDVLVDLLLHTASLVGRGAYNVANVRGSQGNDLIVGDANANVLIGGTGRNVLIGGGGSDTITGGGGFNLLIGGTTAYDANLAALRALMQDWDDPTTTALDQLVNPLKSKKGVTVDGLLLMLNSTTVQSDNAADSLLGGSGLNWFIKDKADIIDNGTGPGANDRLSVI